MDTKLNLSDVEKTEYRYLAHNLHVDNLMLNFTVFELKILVKRTKK